MEIEESIYNLIPKEAHVVDKGPLYKSKHNPKTAPTASTFALKNTSKPNISNVSGSVAAPPGDHPTRSTNAHFGLPKGAAKPNPNQFRLKGTGTIKMTESKFFSFASTAVTKLKSNSNRLETREKKVRAAQAPHSKQR
jgi:hypothetical protein